MTTRRFESLHDVGLNGAATVGDHSTRHRGLVSGDGALSVKSRRRLPPAQTADAITALRYRPAGS